MTRALYSRRAILALCGLSALGGAALGKRNPLATKEGGAKAGSSHRETPLARQEPNLIDWDALKSVNDEVVGWLTVTGTHIDCAVVQPSLAEHEAFYLTHALDRSPSSLGTPYLDIRCDVACAAHLLIHGHNAMASSDGFSDIARAYQKEVFDKMKEASWHTPDGRAVALRPLMAVQIHADCDAVQRFDLLGPRQVQDFLHELEACARKIRKEDAAGSLPNRILTLSTCSSTVPGTDLRTLALFGAYGP